MQPLQAFQSLMRYFSMVTSNVRSLAGRSAHMTQQNAALVEESAAAAQSLREQAQRLSQVVQQFCLVDGVGAVLSRQERMASRSVAALSTDVNVPRLGRA